MTPREILEAAGPLLTPETWTQDENELGIIGKTCLALAVRNPVPIRYIRRALADHGWPEQTDEIASTFGAIPRFNDHPDTTLDDVHWVLRAAIDLAKADET